MFLIRLERVIQNVCSAYRNYAHYTLYILCGYPLVLHYILWILCKFLNNRQFFAPILCIFHL
jgi:hypothetical protein